MKSKIKLYFESLDPKMFNSKSKIKVKSLSKLGSGGGNFNYLVKTNAGKFIFRMNAKINEFGKSKKEYDNLKILEKYDVAPKVYLFDESRSLFDSDFIVLDYVEGLRCTQIKPYFDERMIRNLAELLAKIHSIRINSKIRKLDYYSLSPNDELEFSKNYRRYISKNLKNREFFEMIDSVFSKLKKDFASVDVKSRIVLSHGDFHKENIIVNGEKYHLIDFENLEITNQASALAHLFIDFKHAAFTKKQESIFLNEYTKYVKSIKNLENEISLFKPVKIFNVFLWSVEFALKVKNKQMHEKYLEGKNNDKNVNYAILCFRQALKFGVIDEKYKYLDLREVLN